MSENNQKIIVRYPPSPTGLLHVGNVRTALFNYIFAKQNNGKMILRMEDTDKERSKPEYEKNIIDGLTWLGIEWQGEMWRQSERTEVYKKYLNKLIEDGKAYISEEPEGPNREVVRFRNPNVDIKFDDLIRGEVAFNTEELGDFIIARNINEPVYHLSVVIDDFESGVTHVIRGEDGISNTPRQILIQEALGAPRPIYAHLPLVLAEDRSKLSKRKHGESVSLDYYKNKGYLPEAMINFLSLLGWNPGTEKEIFTINELIKEFSLERVQKKGAIFNVEKLNWINKEHLLRIPEDKQFEIFNSQFLKTKWKDSEKKNDKEFMKNLFSIFIERIHRWGEVGEALDSGEYDYLFEKPELDKEKIAWKKSTKEKTVESLETLLKIIQEEPEEKIADKISEYAEKEGKGDVLWPLRYSLSGKEKSPDPFTLLRILGKEESQRRIQESLEILK